jgi:hypothetical protein
MPATYKLDSSFTASYNRQDDWKRCCAAAMGFEWVDQFPVDGEEEKTEGETVDDGFSSIQQIINLLDEAQFKEEEDDTSSPTTTSTVAAEEEKSEDHWTENALRIQADLTRMSRWIRTKQQEYISLEMKDDEASLIQSTVTSFAATTATELETLRKIIPSSSSNVASHRSGVVQILLSQLQEQITQPFGLLQKQRTRVAVQLWQNPLQCKLYQPKPNANKNATMMQFFDDDDETTEREQRFLPRRQVAGSDYVFISKYTTQKTEPSTPPPRPAFLAKLEHQRRQQEARKSAQDDDGSPNGPMDIPNTLQQPRTPQQQTKQLTRQSQELPYQQQTDEELRQNLNQDLQQEAVLLTQAVNNDLDSVQKMEQRMVEITTLISQFSNLVSEQQEDIYQIHESAKDAKDNIDKGQESLVDASERTKRSKHYMAYSILALSLTLLLFHFLRN